ncbi:MAG: hypothetical protein QY323_04795 [Patescibacteria group bacterium]|nr:MAG: hypothetical protein QY323_04795 [Patescibacteria group bacterium]
MQKFFPAVMFMCLLCFGCDSFPGGYGDNLAGDAEPDPGDAATPHDGASASNDAGASPDADGGTPSDGGTLTDGGAASDGGTLTDGGATSDDGGTQSCSSDSDCQEGQVCVEGVCVCDGEGTSETCADGKTLLCHVPPGHPSRQRDVCVGTHAVDAHLAHGDTLGHCP